MGRFWVPCNQHISLIICLNIRLLIAPAKPSAECAFLDDGDTDSLILTILRRHFSLQQLKQLPREVKIVGMVYGTRYYHV